MTDKTAKKKPTKKGQTKIYVAAFIGAGLIYYLYTKHQANVAAAGTGTTAAGSTTGIDPTTGVPYSSETGSNAIDPSTGLTYGSELSSLTDPNTGQSYSSEVSSLTTQDTALTSEVSNLTSEAQSLTSSLTTLAGKQTVPVASESLSKWKAGALEQLKKAGVAPSVAEKSINEYLNGQAVTNARAATGLTNILSASNPLGAPPTSHGHVLPVRVAKTKVVTPTKQRNPTSTAIDTVKR